MIRKFIEWLLRLIFGGRKTVTVPRPPEEPSVKPPEVHPFFSIVNGNTAWSSVSARETVVMDFMYQERGCGASGEALEAYGIRDPQGLPVKVAVTVQGDVGEEAIFVWTGHDRRRVNGEFLDLSQRFWIWFPGWTKDKPPYPFINPLKERFERKCGNKEYHATIKVTAKNSAGATTYWYKKVKVRA